MHKICELENIAIENIQIETQKKKAKRRENERSPVSWGKKSRVNGIVWHLGEGIKTKRNVLVWPKCLFGFFMLQIMSIAYYKKTQTNIGQPNSDKNNLNNDLDFGKVNTTSKLKIQDIPWRRNETIGNQC